MAAGLTATDVVAMVRIDARTAAGPIDWNANGDASESATPRTSTSTGARPRHRGDSAEIFQGFDDWSNIRLNQVGARRNVGGAYFDRDGARCWGLCRSPWAGGTSAGGTSLRRTSGAGISASATPVEATSDRVTGRWDFGRWDFGRWDFGRWDFGQPTDGRGDDARGYLGGGDLFVNDPNNPGASSTSRRRRIWRRRRRMSLRPA
jgi:hypothetical protein